LKKTIIAAAVISCFALNSEAIELVGTPVNEAYDFKIQVNGEKIDGFIAIDHRDGHYYISKEDLDAIGIKTEKAEMDLLDIDPNAKINYKKATAIINAFPHLFQTRVDSFRPKIYQEVAPSGFGAWVNYDAHVVNYGKQTGLQSLLGFNVSTKWGTLTSQHSYNSIATDEPFKRLATTFRRDNLDDMTTTEIGDTTSSPGYGGTPVRIMGMRMSRNYTINPAFNYQPNFAMKGAAALPSTVEIWEGNTKTYSKNVGAGPFAVTDYKPFSSTGEARMIVRDTFGNEQVVAQPIYASPQQLAAGVDSYSMEFGMLNNGVEYTDPFFGIVYRRGFDFKTMPLIDFLGSVIYNYTIEGRMEGTTNDARLGVGLAFASWLGNTTISGAFGQVDSKSAQDSGVPFVADVTEGSSTPVDVTKPQVATTPSRTTTNSNQSYVAAEKPKLPVLLTVGWDRQLDLGSFGKVSAFASAQIPQNWTNIGALEKSRKVAYAGLAYTPTNDISFNYIGTQSTNIAKKETVTTHTVGASKTFGAWGSLGASISKNDKETSATLTFSIPLGGKGNAYASVSKDNTYVSYSGWNEINDMRWNVGAGKSGVSSQYNASVTSDFRYGRANAQVSSNNGVTGYRVGGAGSLSFADWDVWFARPITQGLVIADVGVPDIEINANNRLAGKTNSNGKVALTEISAWVPNKVSVGNIGDYTLTNASQTTITPRLGGVSYAKLVIDKPGNFLILTVNDKEIESGLITVNGKDVHHAKGAGAYVKNLVVGKNEIKYKGCKQTIEIAADQENINMECKD
jgi:outer membrane usher protein